MQPFSGAVAILLGSGRAGFHVPPQSELFEFRCIWPLHVGGVNLCVNKVVILEFAAAFLTALLFLVAFRKPRVVPRGTQNVMEAIYDFIGKDTVESVIGPKGAVWTPYISILFLFAFLVSLFEVIPLVQFPVSSRFAVPAVLAIGSWVVYNYAGVREKGFLGYLGGIMFPPGVPKLAYILLTPIELLSAIVIRPFTLAIRLFANFFAGHLLLVVFFLGTAYLLAQPMTIAFGVGALAMSVLLVGLELFIAAVQAYVFSILTAVYISLSISHEH
jgi:F-type H+-transporting ATPase subunit a